MTIDDSRCKSLTRFFSALCNVLPRFSLKFWVTDSSGGILIAFKHAYINSKIKLFS